MATQHGSTALMAAQRRGYEDIVSLLTPRNLLPRPKNQMTTKWMGLCNTFGEVGVDALRAIINSHVVESNFERVKSHFGYKESSLQETKISTMRKREICAGLAKYYESYKVAFFLHEGCSNSDTISGDSLSELPPERVIKLVENGQTYCFDVFEVAKLNGRNPFTRQEFPQSFIAEAREKSGAIPRDISMSYINIPT